MPKQEEGKIVYVRLGGKAGKVRGPSGAYREFVVVADDPVSYGDQVLYELNDEGKATIRKRTKYAMR